MRAKLGTRLLLLFWMFFPCCIAAGSEFFINPKDLGVLPMYQWEAPGIAFYPENTNSFVRCAKLPKEDLCHITYRASFNDYLTGLPRTWWLHIFFDRSEMKGTLIRSSAAVKSLKFYDVISLQHQEGFIAGLEPEGQKHSPNALHLSMRRMAELDPQELARDGISVGLDGVTDHHGRFGARNMRLPFGKENSLGLSLIHTWILGNPAPLQKERTIEGKQETILNITFGNAVWMGKDALSFSEIPEQQKGYTSLALQLLPEGGESYRLLGYTYRPALHPATWKELPFWASEMKPHGISVRMRLFGYPGPARLEFQTQNQNKQTHYVDTQETNIQDIVDEINRITKLLLLPPQDP